MKKDLKVAIIQTKVSNPKIEGESQIKKLIKQALIFGHVLAIRPNVSAYATHSSNQG